jgi:hypothetical protein
MHGNGFGSVFRWSEALLSLFTKLVEKPVREPQQTDLSQAEHLILDFRYASFV